MYIRQIINEEVAEYIRKLDSQKKEVEKAAGDFESEQDDRNKLQRGLKLEIQKQKLFSIELKLLKEKVQESKKRVNELRAKLAVLQKSET